MASVAVATAVVVIFIVTVVACSKKNSSCLENIAM